MVRCTTCLVRGAADGFRDRFRLSVVPPVRCHRRCRDALCWRGRANKMRQLRHLVAPRREPTTMTEIPTGDDSVTPDWLWKALETEFGDLNDPCPSDRDPDYDGLRSWWGMRTTAFVNPPYGNIYPWVEKATHAHTTVVMLLPVRTGTDWWMNHHRDFEIRYFRKRINFKGQKRPAFDSCLWIRRP